MSIKTYTDTYEVELPLSEYNWEKGKTYEYTISFTSLEMPILIYKNNNSKKKIICAVPIVAPILDAQTALINFKIISGIYRKIVDSANYP